MKAQNSSTNPEAKEQKPPSDRTGRSKVSDLPLRQSGQEETHRRSERAKLLRLKNRIRARK